MADSPQPAADGIVRAVGEHLAALGLRFTATRRLVVSALAGAGGPQSAADLRATLGDRVPLSSLYRSLGILGRTEAVSRQHGPDGIARYELAEWLTGHHHHLVCTACGGVEDVTVDPEAERAISRLVGRLAERRGYQASGHRIDIEGVCSACREE